MLLIYCFFFSCPFRCAFQYPLIFFVSIVFIMNCLEFLFFTEFYLWLPNILNIITSGDVIYKYFFAIPISGGLLGVWTIREPIRSPWFSLDFELVYRDFNSGVRAPFFFCNNLWLLWNC